MSDAPVYCMDTSAIIEGRRRAYPPDLFPRLWQNIEALIVQGRFVAPEEVRRELAAKDDETFAWAKSRTGLFIPLDADQLRETRIVANGFPGFVNNPRVKNRADPFVIALARARAFTVVTQERPGSPDNPKMPTVCEALQVPYIRFLDMIRQERWRF